MGSIYLSLALMDSQQTAFDDFVDDCYIEDDPICSKNNQKSLEVITSQLITELLTEEDNGILAA